MRVSIITLTYNSKDNINKALDSIESQTYQNIEKVWIDNCSSDGTLEILKIRKDKNTIFISEKDKGISSAFNKGYNKYTGDIVGFLHSDDYLYDKYVIEKIVEEFKNNEINLLFGNLNYLKKNHKILRKWIADKPHNSIKSYNYFSKKLKWGWMAPHPTIYLRREFQKEIGLFDEKFKISFDYDFIIRTFQKDTLRSFYLPQTIVNMKIGGNSNKSILNILKKIREDLQIINKNNLNSYLTLIFKNLRKIHQFFI